MKKMIFTAMLATLAALASCSKNNDEVPAPEYPVGDGARIELTLTSADNQTRAFFAETAAAEPWEKEIKSLVVYVCDTEGALMLKRTLTDLEVSNESARITLPSSAVGTTCSFYVVANRDYGDFGTAGRIEQILDGGAVASVNGAFDVVSNGSADQDGFVMTGQATATIAPLTEPATNVNVTLERVVSKVAIRISTSAAFKNLYDNGTVTIDGIRLNNVASDAQPFAPEPATWMPTSLYQIPGYEDEFANGLFYICQNQGDFNSPQIELVMSGVFDGDGNSATTGDRADVEYETTLNGEGDGTFLRNGYYRVAVSIDGLSGESAVANITVAEWETATPQNINIGE